jgi:signal transduction histidine kinase
MQLVGELSDVLTLSQWTLFHIPLFACALLTGGLAIVGYRYRHRSGAVPLTVLLVGAAIWTFTYGMQLGQTTIGPKLFWSRLTYIGVVSVPVSLLLFTLTYTGRRTWLTPTRWAILCIVPAVELIIALFFTRTIMPSPRIKTEGGLKLLEFSSGNFFWILLLTYLYVLILASIVLVAVEFVQSYRVGRFRGQTLSILFGMCVPLTLDAYAQLNGLNVALAPIGLSVAGVFLSVAVFRYQLFDVSPVARRTVVEQMDDGFVVVDHTGTIIDTNQAALDIVSGESQLVDCKLGSVFSQFTGLSDDPADDTEIPAEIDLTDEDGEERIYEVDTIELTDSRDNKVAVALVLRDVTEKRRRQRELREQKERLERKTDQLEAQNERLDDFASLLSHDIRNPLGVAKGYLDLLDTEGQETEHEKVKDSLERIEQLVDEALQLAKEGHSVTESEAVKLQAVVEQAWETVDTTEATLQSELSGEFVDADPPRLQRLFENLFRNAVEHAGPAVTITVERRDWGFSVADDGPGIPESDRQQIFEKGYTTAADGTGFGLAIVGTIVDAHGWDIDVTESQDGGAAFIIDCQLREQPETVAT